MGPRGPVKTRVTRAAAGQLAKRGSQPAVAHLVSRVAGELAEVANRYLYADCVCLAQMCQRPATREFGSFQRWTPRRLRGSGHSLPSWLQLRKLTTDNVGVSLL